MPMHFRDATVVLVFKNKCSKADCGNYQGISFLSIVGKILAHVILNCLIPSISENNLPESQCGFHPDCSTIDMVFAVCHLQEECIELSMDLYATFIDLTMAFNMVNREGSWVIVSTLGCP